MTESRTVEDRLRAEYFQLVPSMHRTLVALDADVRHHLLPIIISLNRYEQVRVVSRLKECESAVDSLRRRQEARGFDLAKISSYSLSTLRDLVGIRVLVFPSHRIPQVHSACCPYCLTGRPIPYREWNRATIPSHSNTGDGARQHRQRSPRSFRSSPA